MNGRTDHIQGDGKDLPSPDSDATTDESTGSQWQAEHRLMTPSEVAAELRVTTEQVRSLIRRGQLAAFNIGTGYKRPLYRVTPKALEDFKGRRFEHGPATRPKRLKRLPPVPDHFPDL